MVSKIKRSQFRTFLNTGTVGTPTWSLLGDGVVTGVINYNPKVTEETYIVNDSASISVDSYAPKMPIESSAKHGDVVHDYLDALRKSRGVLGTAETEVVNVWYYETPALGYYYAERQAVSLQIDDYGGEGGVAVKFTYTINYIGASVIGGFNPGTLDFQALAGLNTLTTMVIGSVTLAPLFATDKGWLWYAGSVATSTVSMTSTLAGATIEQFKDTTPVSQGQNASLSMGVNHLYIHVTVGGVEVIYNIDITRTA